jgi:hypothetical protein
MTDPRTPRTETGRRLAAVLTRGRLLAILPDDALDAILDIEAEASTLGSSERMSGWKEAEAMASGGATWAPDTTYWTAGPALSDPDAERQRAIGDREQVLLAALVKAHVSGCHMTSGGTEGVWCIDHDAPWAEPESLVCSDGAFIASVLDAAALPAAQEPER